MKIHNYGNDYAHHYRLKQGEAYDKNKAQHMSEVEDKGADQREKTKGDKLSPDSPMQEESIETKEKELGKLLSDPVGGVSEKEQPDRIRVNSRDKKAKTKGDS